MILKRATDVFHFSILIQKSSNPHSPGKNIDHNKLLSALIPTFLFVNKMYFSSHKLFSLLVLASPGSFTPLGQTLLPLNCHSNAQIKDVEYGYKGPGVYHITGLGDLYNLALGDIGSGDGAPAVVWYVLVLSLVSIIIMISNTPIDIIIIITEKKT